MISYKDVVRKGQVVRCLGDRLGPEHGIVGGNQYQVQKDMEVGIFADRPYLTVRCEDGKDRTFHASRFEIVK